MALIIASPAIGARLSDRFDNELIFYASMVIGFVACVFACNLGGGFRSAMNDTFSVLLMLATKASLTLVPGVAVAFLVFWLSDDVSTAFIAFFAAMILCYFFFDVWKED